MLHYAFSEAWCKNPSLKLVRWLCRESWEGLPYWETSCWQVRLSVLIRLDRYLLLRILRQRTCRVASVEPLSKRVEVTLKTPGASSAQKSQFVVVLKVGDIVYGRIKRIERYGLFITIDNTNMVSNPESLWNFFFLWWPDIFVNGNLIGVFLKRHEPWINSISWFHHLVFLLWPCYAF